MALYRQCVYFFEGRCMLLRNKHLTDPIRENMRSDLFHSNRWSNVRYFRERRSKPSIIPIEPPASSGTLLSMKSLAKPSLFTVGFSTTAFTACSIWQYERHRAITLERQKQGFALPIWLQKGEKKALDWRQQVNEFWNSLSEGQKVFAPVLLLNVAVFAAWRVPAWHNFMLTYFASNPAARVVCWPMLLSTFSHYSFLHLAANMFVLHSFSQPFVGSLAREQAAALYLSAGVIASFTSFIHKVVVNKPGLSVGASGAIMAVLGYFSMQYPDAQLSLIFLPMVTFSAGSAIKVIVGIDLAGCLLGWKLFDHAAHLGGTITGILWAYFGPTHIWPLREHLFRLWHRFRQPTNI